MKRARDKDGKFSKIYGEEKVSEPTAADLDKHQADIEAENQARMDTEKKQAVAEGMTLDEEDRAWIRKTVNEKVIQELGIPAPPYSGIALFAASMAILAVLGTLWAVYYVVRPKLDNIATRQSLDMTLCTPVILPSQIVNPKSDDLASHTATVPPIASFPTTDQLPLKDQVLGGGINLVHGLLTLIADEDVWIRVTAISKEERVSIFEGSVKKWWKESYVIAPGINFEIRSGKPGAVSVYIDAKQITPENKYHGGGNLAEYVLDGRELLAGK